MDTTKFDFGGKATCYGVLCADGVTIRKGAFKENNGTKVPLVWQHMHNSPEFVIGHAILENRENDVYAYCNLNDTDIANYAKECVQHGDVTSLSIYANRLRKVGSNVMHGMIREVSLVLAGANEGAKIDYVSLEHSEGDIDDFEAIIYPGSGGVDMEPELMHAEPEKDDETIADIYNSMTEKQKNVTMYMVTEALRQGKEDADDDEVSQSAIYNEEREDTFMKRNVFENAEGEEQVLSHSDMTQILEDAKNCGSLRKGFLQHGITSIETLFPDAKMIDNAPQFITRDMKWVSTVMNGVGKTPFPRIKSIFANLTEDEARAKGYIKGKKKVEEVFSLLKRATTPQTIYKKQKLERDDIIDITDFDVVSWLRGEMRMMLNEEIARAVLVGDGRLSSSDDKISEDHVRPIWTDDDLYTIKATVEGEDKTRGFIKAAIKSRKEYKGSGNPVLFTSEDVLTDMLLLEDTTGRMIYDSVSKLATVLRVSDIVTVPVMEGLTRNVAEGGTKTLMGIIVNLKDYRIGADKGGAVNMFDDFDIDYNAEKYLIETRISGALTRPYSAIAIEA